MNMAFYGSTSSLIRFCGAGQIEASENVMFDIGSINDNKVLLPIVKPSDGKSFHYYEGSSFTPHQGNGVFHLQNTLTEAGMLNIFRNNRFRRIFAKTAGIYGLSVENLQDIRYAFEGNTYQEIFAEKADIIYLEQKRQISNSITVHETPWIHCGPERRIEHILHLGAGGHQ